MASCSLIVSASAAFLLAGCALGPGVETTSSAAFPATAATYRLVGTESASAVDAAVASALRRQMGANGWRETGEDPVWQVEAAYAVRPQRTGNYSDVSAREEAWVAAPVLPQWWARKRQVHSLVVVLNGPDGGPAHQASATVTVRDRDSDATLDLLAAAVAAELKPAS